MAWCHVDRELNISDTGAKRILNVMGSKNWSKEFFLGSGKHGYSDMVCVSVAPASHMVASFATVTASVVINGGLDPHLYATHMIIVYHTLHVPVSVIGQPTNGHNSFRIDEFEWAFEWVSNFPFSIVSDKRKGVVVAVINCSGQKLSLRFIRRNWRLLSRVVPDHSSSKTAPREVRIFFHRAKEYQKKVCIFGEYRKDYFGPKILIWILKKKSRFDFIFLLN